MDHQEYRDHQYHHTIGLLQKINHPDNLRSQIYLQNIPSSNNTQKLIRGIKKGTNHLFDETDDYKQIKNCQPSIKCINKSISNYEADLQVSEYQTIQYTLIQCLHLIYREEKQQQLYDFVFNYMKGQPSSVDLLNRIWPLLVTFFDKRLARKYRSVILISLSNGNGINDRLKKLTNLYQKLSIYEGDFFNQLISKKPSQKAAFLQQIQELRRCVYYLKDAQKNLFKKTKKTTRQDKIKKRQKRQSLMLQIQLQQINQAHQLFFQNIFGQSESYNHNFLGLYKLSDLSQIYELQ